MAASRAAPPRVLQLNQDTLCNYLTLIQNNGCRSGGLIQDVHYQLDDTDLNSQKVKPVLIHLSTCN